MKKLKYFFLSILVLIIVLLIAAIFLPKEYTVKVNKKIETESIYVYNLINDMTNRIHWDEKMMSDSLSESTIEISENGNSYKWKNKFNEGLYRITNASKNELINAEYQVNSEVVRNSTFKFSEENGKTNVYSESTFRSNWPLNLLNFIRKIKAEDKLEGELNILANIANERSSKNLYNGYTLTEEIVKDKNLLIKRDVVKMDNIQQFYVQNLGVLFKDAQTAGLEMDGMPCGLFFNMNESNQTADMAAAIPVSEEVNIPNATSLLIPTRKGVVVDYYGDYNNTMLAHQAMDAFFEDRSLTVEYPVIEEYVTDPSEEKDPSKWLTKITYYIADK